MVARKTAEVIYIGYPKAASTFVGQFLKDHPQVTLERIQLDPFYAASIDDITPAPARHIERGKVHVRHNEKIAESICVVGDSRIWNQNRYVPGTWDRVKDEVVLGPGEAAQRLK